MKAKHIEHAVVFRDDNWFCAWPFNGGFWQFADGELAVGFFRGPCDYTTPGAANHGTVDREHVVVRSRDGGRIWPAASLTSSFFQDDLAQTMRGTKPSVAAEQGYDHRADGFCVMGGFGHPPTGATHLAYALISTDRARTWSKPHRMPTGIVRTHGFKLLSARPSYIIRPDGMLLLFCHGARVPFTDADFHIETGVSNGVVFGSWDGGGSWGIIGEIPAEPATPGLVMPSPLLLDDGTILVSARRQYDGPSAHATIHESKDGGRTWRFISRVNDWGAPAHLSQLPDGRIVCTYGYRQKPWGVRARVSDDRGRSWSTEIILRDDGGSWDLGYPRTQVRPDGSLVSVYYFNSKTDTIQHDGGVRHIAATLWAI